MLRLLMVNERTVYEWLKDVRIAAHLSIERVFRDVPMW